MTERPSVDSSSKHGVARVRIRQAIGYLLGLVLLMAGILHAENPWGFWRDLRGYQLLPFELAIVVATLLPLLQITLGVTLVFGFWSRASFGLTIVMLAIFLTAEAAAVVRELDIPCGCFGSFSPRIGWQSISLTGFLLAAATAGWWLASPVTDDPGTGQHGQTEVGAL